MDGKMYKHLIEVNGNRGGRQDVLTSNRGGRQDVLTSNGGGWQNLLTSNYVSL